MVDDMKGPAMSACGQEAYFGTNSFKVLVDLEKIASYGLEEVEDEPEDDHTIDALFDAFEDPNDVCNVSNITINNTAQSVKTAYMGEDDDYDIDL